MIKDYIDEISSSFPFCCLYVYNFPNVMKIITLTKGPNRTDE